MKNFNRVFVPVLAALMAMTFFFACGDNGTSTTNSGTDTTGTDTSILDDANNSYPNDRIHITDSNKATDSLGRDSIKK